MWRQLLRVSWCSQFYTQLGFSYYLVLIDYIQAVRSLYRPLDNSSLPRTLILLLGHLGYS